MARERTGAGLRLVAEGRDGSRRRPDVDRHVARRIRGRRILLGLSLQRVAELIGVTHHQAHKYEKGVNRISAGRLHRIARALGVDVAHFYEGLGGEPAGPARDRRVLDLARDFTAIADPRRRGALCHLARVLAGGPPGGEDRP